MFTCSYLRALTLLVPWGATMRVYGKEVYVKVMKIVQYLQDALSWIKEKIQAVWSRWREEGPEISHAVMAKAGFLTGPLSETEYALLKRVSGIMGTAVAQYEYQRQVNVFPQIGWTRKDLEGPEFSRIQYLWFGTHNAAIAKMIVGTASQFEPNYAAYQKVFRDNDWDKGMEEAQLAWKTIFDSYVYKYWK